MDNARSMMLKILLPVALGLAVVVWMFLREFDAGAWTAVAFDARTVAAIAIAVAFMCLRELGLTWRFRVLTDRHLSWRQALRVSLLCEFTSAVTPTTAGGSAMSMFFMHREGISLGRGTSIMMTSLFLDEFFNVVLCPVVFLLAPASAIFGFGGAFNQGIRASFWTVMGLIIAVTAILFWGTLLRPEGLRRTIIRLFSFRWLRRWRDKALSTADDIVVTGHDLRRRSAPWWARAFCATSLVWVARFMVVNALFWGFVPAAPQLVVFARQFVVWTLLTVSPTPGGSGLSEWLFTTYYGDLIGAASVALVIAVFWRLITYYSLLAAGAVMLPSYIRGFRRKEKDGSDSPEKNQKS